MLLGTSVSPVLVGAPVVGVSEVAVELDGEVVGALVGVAVGEVVGTKVSSGIAGVFMSGFWITPPASPRKFASVTHFKGSSSGQTDLANVRILVCMQTSPERGSARTQRKWPSRASSSPPGLLGISARATRIWCAITPRKPSTL